MTPFYEDDLYAAKRHHDEGRGVTYTEERVYLPTGCDRDNIDAFSFQVTVTYRGKGKWMVATSREGHMQLSRTGKWLFCPLKMTAMRWCRFDFETACALAEKHVDSRIVNRRTWAEWEALRATQ